MIKAICLGRVTYEIDLVIEKQLEEGSTNEFFDKKGDIGGHAGVVGCCFSKWGIATAVAAVIGNDMNGMRIRKKFEKAHIDTRFIEPTYENDTPVSVVQINKTTKKQTTMNLSDKYISLKKCDFDFMPDIIFVDGYDSVQAKNLLERFPRVISVLDASLITSAVLDLVRKAKVVVATQEFAENAANQRIDFQDTNTLITLFQRLQKKYLKTEFVITLGERGAMYCINNQIKISPTLKVNAVDTHSCGYIFRAALAYTLVNGGDIEKAVKMGCIAAGLSAEKIGTTETIPTLEEIKKVYEQNY